MIQETIDEVDKKFMGDNYFKGRVKKIQKPLKSTEADIIINSNALDVIIDGAKKAVKTYAETTNATPEEKNDFMSQVKELVMQKLRKGGEE